MPTIIYPPSLPWNWMFQRPQQLLLRLSELGYDILYEDQGRFKSPQVKKISPGFRLCQGFSALRLNQSRPRILWLTVPRHITLLSLYQPDLVIYDAVDEPKEEFAAWAPYYPMILKKSHLILTSGQSIYHTLSTLHPNVHLIPNGVDFQHFNKKQPRPNDLIEHPHLVGYSGAIASWLDWKLLNDVTEANPTIAFVFIGSLFRTRRFPLQGKNIHYLGLKPYSSLPGYLQHFKLGLIPFRLTEMTKGCDPIKLYEYYASGLPVLSTPLPEVLTVPAIHIEGNPESFSARLQTLVSSGDHDHSLRLNFSQENDWTQRARQIDQLIRSTLLKQQSSL